ncbi:MAG: hypothetical protein HUJ96_07435 [Marinilabiliaceae bacterium]|nr:hypothetical protein [Marinilabiliaceae bacterium]
MAVLSQGIFGGFVGRIGGVVGYYRQGKAVVRALPSKPMGAPTRKQSESRKRFGTLRKVIPYFIPAMKVGFRSQLTDKMVHCVGFSELWKRGVVGDAPACEIDYSKIVVSIGHLRGLNYPSVIREGNKAVGLWQADTDTEQTDENDEVYLCAYSENETVVRISKAVTRSRGRISLEIPAGKVHCYIFCASATSKDTSMSEYFSV